MLADQHSLVVRKVPNVGVEPLWIQVHAAQNQSQGILIRQLFAFSRGPAKMPCFIGSPELLDHNKVYILWCCGLECLRRWTLVAENRSSGECWLEDGQDVAVMDVCYGGGQGG